jgi:hypothetical protein
MHRARGAGGDTKVAWPLACRDSWHLSTHHLPVAFASSNQTSSTRLYYRIVLLVVRSAIVPQLLSLIIPAYSTTVPPQLRVVCSARHSTKRPACRPLTEAVLRFLPFERRSPLRNGRDSDSRPRVDVLPAGRYLQYVAVCSKHKMNHDSQRS